MRTVFRGRTPLDIASGGAALGLLALISVIAWRSLPHFGGNGRLMFGLISVVCAYQLTNGGDGKRNLVLRTLAWLGPVLLLQLAFQALVAMGVTTLD